MCAQETEQVTRQVSLLGLIEREPGMKSVNSSPLQVIFDIWLCVHTPLYRNTTITSTFTLLHKTSSTYVHLCVCVWAHSVHTYMVTVNCCLHHGKKRPFRESSLHRQLVAPPDLVTCPPHSPIMDFTYICFHFKISTRIRLHVAPTACDKLECIQL